MIKAVYLIRFGGENIRLLPEYNPGRDPEAMGCEGDGRAGSSRHDSLTRFIHQGPPEAGAQLAMTRGPGLLASHDRAGAPRAIRGFASARPGRSPCDLREPTGVPNRREACREVDGWKAFHFGFAGSIQGPAMASRAATSSSK